MIFLKSRYTFKTYKQITETNYEIFLDSFDEEASQVDVPIELVNQEDDQSWCIVEHRPYLIESISLADDGDTIALSEPLKIFDRDVYCDDELYTCTSTNGFITKLVEKMFGDSQTDPEYAMPYFEIDNAAVTDTCIFPQEVKNAKDNEDPDSERDVVIFNPYNYFAMLRSAYDIGIEFTYSDIALTMRLWNRSSSTRNVVFNDGVSVLESVDFGSDDTVAKVTVLQKTSSSDPTIKKYDYYMLDDGTMSAENPSPIPRNRMTGKWVIVEAGLHDSESGPEGETDESLRKDAAEQEFGENAGAMNIEFQSFRKLELGDVVTMRIRERVVKGLISSIKCRSDNALTYYTVGDLATDLVTKIKRKG